MSIRNICRVPESMSQEGDYQLVGEDHGDGHGVDEGGGDASGGLSRFLARLEDRASSCAVRHETAALHDMEEYEEDGEAGGGDGSVVAGPGGRGVAEIADTVR